MVIEKKNGVLWFDGVNTVGIAEKYGTPVYVLSKTEIESRCQEFRNCFLDKYPNTRIAYASKAFLPLAMCKIMEKEGMGLDVVSGGEIYTAMEAGFPMERVEFNGNNKSIDELTLAIECGVGRIIVDSVDELYLIEEICREKGKKTNILYRINPAVEANTHAHMVTGNKDSKFGIDLSEDVIMPAIKNAIESEYVNFLGFHFHVGAGIYENEPYLDALEVALNLIKRVKLTYSYAISELNIGGGFAATFVQEKKRPPYAYYLEPIMERIDEFSAEIGIPCPAVVIEPGRSMVAEAGITLYSIGSIKEIKDVRKYVAVDGGMTDNIRVELYDAKYEGCIANRVNEPESELVTICGKCCESGDIVIRDIMLPPPKRGDIFALYATGCYCYAMSSNYNKIPKAPVLLVKDGKEQLIVKRQSYADMIQNEVRTEKVL